MTNIPPLWRQFLASVPLLTLNFADVSAQPQNTVEHSFVNSKNHKTIVSNQKVSRKAKQNPLSLSQWKKDHQGQSVAEQQDELYNRIVVKKSRKSQKARVRRFAVIADKLNLFKDDYSETIDSLKAIKQTNELNKLWHTIDLAETANIKRYLSQKSNKKAVDTKLLAFAQPVKLSNKKNKSISQRYISDSLSYEQTLALVSAPDFVKNKDAYKASLRKMVKIEATYHPAPVTNPTHDGYYQFDKGAQKRHEAEVGVKFPETRAALSTWEGKVIQHKYAKAYYTSQYNYIVEQEERRIREGKRPVTDRAYLVDVRDEHNHKAKKVIILEKEDLAFSLWAGSPYYKQLEDFVDSKANRNKKILKLPRHKNQDFGRYAAFAGQDIAHREQIQKIERELIAANYNIIPTEYAEDKNVITASVPVIERPVLAETRIDTLKSRFIQSSDAIVLFDKPRIIAVSGSAVPQTTLTN